VNALAVAQTDLEERLDSRQEIEAACERVYHAFKAYQWPAGMEHMADIGTGLAQAAIRASSRRSYLNVPKESLHGVRLDVGCGFNKQDGFIGMDRRPETNAEIIHDVSDLPWPLEDNSCRFVLLSHVLEHLDPKYNIDLFNEIWRVLEPRGKVMVAVPWPGSKSGYQDPTHVRSGFLPETFMYFCPDIGQANTNPLYNVYRPKPFKLVGTPDIMVGVYCNVVLEVMKRTEPDEPMLEIPGS